MERRHAVNRRFGTPAQAPASPADASGMKTSRILNRTLPLLWTLIVLAPVCRAAADPVRYRIAVVDMFVAADDTASALDLLAAGAPDLDGDGQPERMGHGDLVCLFLDAPGLETVPFPVHDAARAKTGILARLDEIRARRAAGERLDAVMLCWESSTRISAFGDGGLDPARRAEYRAVLRDWGREHSGWRLTAAIIDRLEALAADGVIVVTIAGNAGPRWVNTYSFAEGVIVVGAAEPDEDLVWAARNALIGMWNRSRFPVRLVSEADRPAYGYDLDGDGVADVDLRRGSSWYRRFRAVRDSRLVLSGTSCTAPQALRGLLTRND